MASSNRCFKCNKESGPMYCTGCDKYFCWKDFKTHREEMFTEMDKIVEERNHLQEIINNEIQHSDRKHPLLQQIDEWQKNTITKVNQVAAQARQQTVELLSGKQVKISNEFQNFSRELAQLRESENYVEHDINRLNQLISQFKQDLKQANQPIDIVLHTERSDRVDWKGLIYVEEGKVVIKNTQQASAIGKMMSIICKNKPSHRGSGHINS